MSTEKEAAEDSAKKPPRVGVTRTLSVGNLRSATSTAGSFRRAAGSKDAPIKKKVGSSQEIDGGEVNSNKSPENNIKEKEALKPPTPEPNKLVDSTKSNGTKSSMEVTRTNKSSEDLQKEQEKKSNRQKNIEVLGSKYGARKRGGSVILKRDAVSKDKGSSFKDKSAADDSGYKNNKKSTKDKEDDITEEMVRDKELELLKMKEKFLLKKVKGFGQDKKSSKKEKPKKSTVDDDDRSPSNKEKRLSKKEPNIDDDRSTSTKEKRLSKKEPNADDNSIPFVPSGSGTFKEKRLSKREIPEDAFLSPRGDRKTNDDRSALHDSDKTADKAEKKRDLGSSFDSKNRRTINVLRSPDKKSSKRESSRERSPLGDKSKSDSKREKERPLTSRREKESKSSESKSKGGSKIGRDKERPVSIKRSKDGGDQKEAIEKDKKELDKSKSEKLEKEEKEKKKEGEEKKTETRERKQSCIINERYLFMLEGKAESRDKKEPKPEEEKKVVEVTITQAEANDDSQDRNSDEKKTDTDNTSEESKRKAEPVVQGIIIEENLKSTSVEGDAFGSVITNITVSSEEPKQENTNNVKVEGQEPNRSTEQSSQQESTDENKDSPDGDDNKGGREIEKPTAEEAQQKETTDDNKDSSKDDTKTEAATNDNSPSQETTPRTPKEGSPRDSLRSSAPRRQRLFNVGTMSNTPVVASGAESNENKSPTAENTVSSEGNDNKSPIIDSPAATENNSNKSPTIASPTVPEGNDPKSPTIASLGSSTNSIGSSPASARRNDQDLSKSTTQVKIDSWNKMPIFLLKKIIGYLNLDGEAVNYFGLVCKAFSTAADDQHLWKKIYNLKWTSSNVVDDSGNWKGKWSRRMKYTLDQGTQVFNTLGPEKGIQYLIQERQVEDDARSIAKFLVKYNYRFDNKRIEALVNKKGSKKLRKSYEKERESRKHEISRAQFLWLVKNKKIPSTWIPKDFTGDNASLADFGSKQISRSIWNNIFIYLNSPTEICTSISLTCKKFRRWTNSNSEKSENLWRNIYKNWFWSWKKTNQQLPYWGNFDAKSSNTWKTFTFTNPVTRGVQKLLKGIEPNGTESGGMNWRKLNYGDLKEDDQELKVTKVQDKVWILNSVGNFSVLNTQSSEIVAQQSSLNDITFSSKDFKRSVVGLHNNSIIYFNPSNPTQLYTYSLSNHSWSVSNINSTNPVLSHLIGGIILSGNLYIFSDTSRVESLNLSTLVWETLHEQRAEDRVHDESNDKDYQQGQVVDVGDRKLMVLSSKRVRIWDMDKSKWEEIEEQNKTSGRYGFSAVKVGYWIFVYGGKIGNEKVKELVLLNMENMAWYKTKCGGEESEAPGERVGCEAVVVGRNMYLFGGVGSTWRKSRM
eukprot:TRINITY_DN5473_c0_g1_i2.p1 TRINITY_DN5473_c0_g1~~TRINITY_DN5473_c0_g1_i2.p1  ORF type:complete len:1368 (-),score=366.46 TRINITY_DN5473_c0_g1_i2:42-4145(-)